MQYSKIYIKHKPPIIKHSKELTTRTKEYNLYSYSTQLYILWCFYTMLCKKMLRSLRLFRPIGPSASISKINVASFLSSKLCIFALQIGCFTCITSANCIERGWQLWWSRMRWLRRGDASPLIYRVCHFPYIKEPYILVTTYTTNCVLQVMRSLTRILQASKHRYSTLYDLGYLIIHHSTS